jgi:hypothetical protein
MKVNRNIKPSYATGNTFMPKQLTTLSLPNHVTDRLGDAIAKIPFVDRKSSAPIR